MAKRTILRKLNHKTFYALAAVLVIAALAIWLFFGRPTNSVIPVTGSSTAENQPVSGKLPTGPSSSNTNTSSSESSQTNQNGSTSSQSQTLLTPWGDFVSNHYPGKNNSPTTEVSVCNTTPGASCYIQFTNGNNVHKLPTQTANGNGSTSWQWDVKNAGFSSGSWQITAVAALNGQTKSADDPLSLTISP